MVLAGAAVVEPAGVEGGVPRVDPRDDALHTSGGLLTIIWAQDLGPGRGSATGTGSRFGVVSSMVLVGSRMR